MGLAVQEDKAGQALLAAAAAVAAAAAHMKPSLLTEVTYVYNCGDGGSGGDGGDGHLEECKSRF